MRRVRIGKRQSYLSDKARIRFYSALNIYLKNGEKLDTALEEMYKVYSHDGKKTKGKLQLLIRDVLTKISNGNSFSYSMAEYLNEHEYFLLTAGEKSASLGDSLMQSIKLINGKKRMRAAVAGATVYNCFLFVLIVGLLVLTSLFLIPTITVNIDPNQFTGLAKLVYVVSDIVTSFGLLFLVLFFALFVGIRVSLPRYIGRTRVRLDRMYPYSLYRTVNGTTFLISISALLQAGVQLGAALEELEVFANPYMKQRIGAVKYGTAMGNSLGESLHISGYEFPDREAIQHLRLLGGRQGLDKAIASFADDWLEETIRKIESTGQVVGGLGVLLALLMGLVIILGTTQMQQVSQQAMGIL